jgi:hypothetical protein
MDVEQELKERPGLVGSLGRCRFDSGGPGATRGMSKNESRESPRVNAQYDLSICYPDKSTFTGSPMRRKTLFTSLKNN